MKCNVSFNIVGKLNLKISQKFTGWKKKWTLISIRLISAKNSLSYVCVMKAKRFWRHMSTPSCEKTWERCRLCKGRLKAESESKKFGQFVWTSAKLEFRLELSDGEKSSCDFPKLSSSSQIFLLNWSSMGKTWPSVVNKYFSLKRLTGLSVSKSR